MESCSPEEAKKHYLAMLLAFRKLGSDGGLGGGRIWLLVDTTRARGHERANTLMSIHELLGFDVAKLKTQKIIKRYWKKDFQDGMGIGRGFVGRRWKDDIFIMICDNSSLLKGHDTPDKGTMIHHDSCSAEKIRKSISSNISPSPPVLVSQEITPTKQPEKGSTKCPKRIMLQDNHNMRKVRRQVEALEESIPVLPPSPTFTDEDSRIKWIEAVALPLLTEHIDQCSNILSTKIQSLAYKVIQKMEDTSSRFTDIIYYDTNGRQRYQKYLRLKVARGSHEASSAKAHSYLVTRKANEIDEAAEAVFNGKFSDDFIEHVFEKLAKRRGLAVFKHEGLQLTIAEIASLRDFCGLSSNKTFKLKQAIEVLRPQLKGVIFVPAIQRRLTELEREGNLPVEVRKQPLIIKKEGNKRDLRIVWWLQEPAKMMERLVNLSVIDGTFEASEEFSSIVGEVVVLWGIDKSAKDTGCAIRIANRKEGNSSLFTQLLGGIEDSCECHSNLKATFFSKECPLRSFLQCLVYDHYHMLIVKIGGTCQSFTFLPYPTLDHCITRPISVTSVKEIDVERVSFHPVIENGLPPQVTMPIDTREVSISLVTHSFDEALPKSAKTVRKKSIVGFELLIGSVSVFAQRFSDSIGIETNAKMSDAEVSIKQVNGHPANDYKQSLILSGIGSASAICSCVCCMEEKSSFHIPSERFQKHRDPAIKTV